MSGYEELYQVSNLGNVRSLFRYKKQLKPCKNNIGYLYVNLYKNKKIKRLSIHRLVAKAFIDNPENLPQVNHIDGDKFNNNISNLEWVTASQNVSHRFKELGQKPFKKYKNGEFDFNSKEGMKKYSKNYYKKNKEKILEYQRKWRISKKQNCYKVVD